MTITASSEYSQKLLINFAKTNVLYKPSYGSQKEINVKKCQKSNLSTQWSP